ncbi:MAG: LacI family DNA-binding transcriptional regulator [Terrimicrobiaceae bacterium]
METKPNMTAIAREAGVGKATVSLALRNDPRLRPETRERIQEVARRMGYQANAVVSNLMAQLRASRNPKFQATIGLLNASSTRDGLRLNFTYRTWAAGLQQRCAELGYSLDEFWLWDPGMSPARLKQTLRARNIRGVVVAGIFAHRELPAELDILWQDLACVVVGIRPERPTMHFACNDQYSTAMHAAWEIGRLGYKKPALIIDPVIEENIDHRFTAGFASGWRAINPTTSIPYLPFERGAEGVFPGWLSREEPDVIVCTHPEVRDWITRMGWSVPSDIGLAHLDLTPEIEGWSGMNQNNQAVGAFAIDLVVGQLHRNETGVPSHPKCMMTESQWVPGQTLRTSEIPKPARRRRTIKPKKAQVPAV